MNLMAISFDLKARAHQAMLDAGFHPDFPPEVLSEAQSPKPAVTGADLKDMRDLLWSSIDNDSSLDLDQVEYVERLTDGTIRLMVGVADVDSLVPMGSATDQHAASETTSVYPVVTVYPMLPDTLSTDRTSLVGDQDRVAVIIEMHIKNSGEVDCHDVCRARLRNHAKLAYNATGQWLQGAAPMPAAVAKVPGLEAQLRLQLEASQKLQMFRKNNGALTFGSIEPSTIMENNLIKDITVTPHNVAQDIIESFMVAANVSMAQFLKENHSFSIRRIVRVPKRWDRIQAIAQEYNVKLASQPDPRALSDFLAQRLAADPVHFPDLSLSIIKLLGPGEYVVEQPGREQEGHFGLAVQDYTHSTAPNRRFPDLVTQRLLKAVMAGKKGPYEAGTLAEIAKRCTERGDASRKVERVMRKVVAATFLQNQIGQVFDGVITGATPKGTFARIFKPPAEGMVVRGARGADVGDRVRVKLVGASPAQGFIDFERV